MKFNFQKNKTVPSFLPLPEKVSFQNDVRSIVYLSELIDFIVHQNS